MQAICSFEGCGRHRNYKETGLCEAHHAQWKKGQPLRPRRGGEKPQCSHEGCEALSRSRGMCVVHYQQWYKYGKTFGPGAPKHCKAAECTRPVSSRGFCESHLKYGEWAEIRGSRALCLVPGCGDAASSTKSKLCPKHNLRRSRFGLTREQLVEIMSLGSCEACGFTGPDLDIHHDHSCCDAPGKSCGKCVVAYLCGPCNRALGHAKDDPNVLRKLAEITERGYFFSE